MPMMAETSQLSNTIYTSWADGRISRHYGSLNESSFYEQDDKMVCQECNRNPTAAATERQAAIIGDNQLTRYLQI
jgi:hypothetical protein